MATTTLQAQYKVRDYLKKVTDHYPDGGKASTRLGVAQMILAGILADDRLLKGYRDELGIVPFTGVK